MAKTKRSARKGAARKSVRKRAASSRKGAARRAPRRRARAAGAARDLPPAGVLAGATKKQVEIGEFFQKVAAGMVEAQRTLDDQSLLYLTAAANQPHVVPSVFRIPRLSADISFALEDVEQKKVSLVFWGNTSEAKTLHQQSIHFDLVTSPPSPDFTGTGLLQLLLSRPLRDPVLTSADPKPWTDQTKDEVVIFQLLEDHFVLAFANSENTELTLVYVRRGSAPGSAVIRATAAVPQPLRGLYEALRELARRQRPLLS